MKEFVLKILDKVFGDKPGKRFKRIMIMFITIIIGTILILNVGFNITVGGCTCNYKQADVKINR